IQGFVTVTDEKLNQLMTKIADNAQYFENRAPWKDEYKKQGVRPPVAMAVETFAETGDFNVNTVGDNLPNENEIHEKYGTKNFFFTGSTRAFSRATGTTALQEFAASPEEVRIVKAYGDEAENLMTALHEVVGHGSGKLSPKLTHEPQFYLKEYYSTLEEARADLMALWNISDPKLRELGLVSNPDVAKAMYYNAARVMLTQLRSTTSGDQIEEDHQRDRQLIARYKKLNLPTYWAGINPELTPTTAGDRVTSVSISYPRDLMRQRLAYSAMYEPSLVAATRGTQAQPRRGSRR